jgi:hypothetical protein
MATNPFLSSCCERVRCVSKYDICNLVVSETMNKDKKWIIGFVLYWGYVHMNVYVLNVKGTYIPYNMYLCVTIRTHTIYMISRSPFHDPRFSKK